MCRSSQRPARSVLSSCLAESGSPAAHLTAWIASWASTFRNGGPPMLPGLLMENSSRPYSRVAPSGSVMRNTRMRSCPTTRDPGRVGNGGHAGKVYIGHA